MKDIVKSAGTSSSDMEKYMPESGNGFTRLRARFFALCLGLIACLVMLEAFLWISGFFYSGDRSRDEKSGGRNRVILCLGDSFTFGYGLPQNQTYPAHLERLLNAGGYRFRVINLGIPGQNTSQLFERLPFDMMKYRPAILVVLIGNNNLWNFHGFAGHKTGATAFSKLEKKLYSIKTYKLFRLLLPGFLKAARLEEFQTHFDGIKVSLGRGLLFDFMGWHAVRFRGDTSAALDFFSRALSLNDSDFLALKGTGRILLKRGRIDDAGIFLEKARKILSDDIEVSIDLIHISQMKKNRGEEFAGSGLPKEYACFEMQDKKQYVMAFKCFMNECRQYPHKWKKLSGSFAELTILTGLRREASEFLHEMIKKGNPDARDSLVFLENGGKKELDAWVRGDILKIIRTARASGTKVVLQNYPRHPESGPLEIYASLKKEDVAYVDNYDVFNNLLREGHRPEDYFLMDNPLDGYGHCNSTGAFVMAK
ncbi:MAG: GDSL-type esterase/lipase family protein, partial [bacterium]